MFTEESRAFVLEGTRTGKIATVRADGRPHVAPVWFTLDSDTVIFTTGHTTVKAANIRDNSYVAICVDDEIPPFSFALIEGTAELSDDLDALKEWATKLARRYMGDELAEAYGKRNAVEGELLVRVTPTKVVFKKAVAD
jgi:PPOX class probable F420-dependent enzyme